MPFQSASQSRKCFAMKRRGENDGWDCEEWAEHTDYESLPERAKQRRKQAALNGIRRHALTKLARFLERAVMCAPGGRIVKRAAALRSLQLLTKLQKGASLQRAIDESCPDLPPRARKLLFRTLVRGAASV